MEMTAETSPPQINNESMFATETNASENHVIKEDSLNDPLCDDEPQIEEITSFEDMGLRSSIFRGILAYGFETPSIIQQKAIPAFVKHNRDIIAQAQSGTGKTATFSVALLQKIVEEDDALQGVILAPTRELASQIHGVITALGQFSKVRISLVSGGGNVRQCVEQLRNDRPHVIVATPGRMAHILRDRYVNPRYIKYFIMDEADELLSDGFTDQVREIIRQLPQEVQIGLYTATITETMNDIVKKFMRNPIEVRVRREQLTLEGIRQYKIVLNKHDWKFATLIDLFGSISIYQMMIYCNSKRNVDYLKRQLDHEKIPCEAIHSELSADERRDIMHRFRSGDVRVLVTTDLLCRGIDIQQVSLVINYDLPREVASYLHRIGRGGRFGRKGYAINMVVHDPDSPQYNRNGTNDKEQLNRIENYYETQICTLPEDLKAAFS